MEVRNRKTGRRRHLHENAEKEREKQKKEEERKKVYDKWGKGLKQIEEFNERMATDAHEMNKPMARYADDKDLEEYLRNQTRDGDPMADYFRRKAKERKGAGGPCKSSKKFVLLDEIKLKMNFLFFCLHTQLNQSTKDHIQRIVTAFDQAIDGMVLTVQMDMKRNGSMYKIRRKRLRKRHTNTALKICKPKSR